MHGIGNDYVYFDAFDGMPENPDEIARRISDRHFWIGSDGVIFVTDSAVADGGMRMFNADGSEGKMCGNGIRCVGKFLYDFKGIRKNPLTVETKSGVKTLKLFLKNGEVDSVRVDMGKAELNPQSISALFSGGKVVNEPLAVDGKTYGVTLVSMGNPHCVIFGNTDLVDRIGKRVAYHKNFPDGVNAEFVEVVSGNELNMRVYERGSGETLACGTGACASVVAAVLNGYCKAGEEITVHLRGGDLKIVYADGNVSMTGGATLAFTGEVDI